SARMHARTSNQVFVFIVVVHRSAGSALLRSPSATCRASAGPGWVAAHHSENAREWRNAPAPAAQIEDDRFQGLRRKATNGSDHPRIEGRRRAMARSRRT